MSFSYSGDPRNSDKDQVRFLIGDTDANSPQFQDTEILYLIQSEGTALSAAVAGALGLSAKYSRLMDESVGSISKSYSQRVEHYRNLSASLRTRNAEKSVCPFAGGLTHTDKDVINGNSDSIHPAFSRDLHNNPLSTGDPANDDENLGT